MNDSNLNHVRPGQPIGTQPINALVDAARRPVAGDGVANTPIGVAHIRRSAPSPFGLTSVKVMTVNPLYYTVKLVNQQTGEEIGEEFDAYPRVMDGGTMIDSGYDLTATDGTVVMEAAVVGGIIDIFPDPMTLYRGTPNPDRHYFVAHLHHLSSCETA